MLSIFVKVFARDDFKSQRRREKRAKSRGHAVETEEVALMQGSTARITERAVPEEPEDRAAEEGLFAEAVFSVMTAVGIVAAAARCARRATVPVADEESEPEEEPSHGPGEREERQSTMTQSASSSSMTRMRPSSEAPSAPAMDAPARVTARPKRIASEPRRPRCFYPLEGPWGHVQFEQKNRMLREAAETRCPRCNDSAKTTAGSNNHYIRVKCMGCGRLLAIEATAHG